jgi:MraZ protein
MEYIGIEFYLGLFAMLAFCGHDCCSIDSNGRIKFSPRVLKDFDDKCRGDVVLHCLPEGAIAIYPEDVYLEMRRHEEAPAARAASSMVFRRSMRRFGAMSKSDKISKQGRITIPPAYRSYAALEPGADICVVGVEIGIEIWNTERWNEEINKINDHVREKGMQEMTADLLPKEND